MININNLPNFKNLTPLTTSLCPGNVEVIPVFLSSYNLFL